MWQESCYIDSNTATVLGYNYQVGSTDILRTTNGGANWFSQFSWPFAWTNDISFKDLNNGIAIFGDIILITTNGGTDWVVSTGVPANNGLLNVDYILPNNATVVGSSGTILNSTDGGLIWTQQSSGITSSLVCVDVINANYGFIVGELGVILKTGNGGQLWMNQTSGTRANLRGVSFVNKNLGMAIGNNGKIIKTTNGGLSWISQTSGIAVHLRGISYINSNTATVVGENGTIIRTTNGGNNWDSQTTGTTNNLLGISFIDVDNGVAVGENGTVLRTNNGGATWTLQTSGTTQQLNSVFFIDENNGSAVGGDWWVQEGIILRTTNGGINWTSQTMGIPDDMFGIYFTDINHGTAVGGDGTIVRTSDGGNSWTNQPSGTYNTLWAVSFANQNDGLAIGTNSSQNIFSVILRTTNGGVDWITQNSLCANMLLGVSFVDSLAATAVGVGGAIIRTVNGGFIPVELVSFNAKLDGKSISLNWSTVTETNNQGFEIQRKQVFSNQSAVGNQEWEVLGFVNGNGTTTEPQTYSFVDENLSTGNFHYRLKQIDFDGTFEYSNTIEVEIGSPNKFTLSQNYPNPFNPSTTIKYAISSRQFVSLKVFDVLGKEVATLVNEEKSAGNYEVEFNVVSSNKNPASGIYFYQLKAGDFVETKKMLLIK